MEKAALSVFEQRLSNHKNELQTLYHEVYKDNIYYHGEEKFNNLLTLMRSYDKQRKAKYKKADLDNSVWYKKNNIVGITLYVDLFSGNFTEFKKRIPYFKELGITFIHFMPILESREGENDGGYAVKNYKSIDKKFGSNEEFDSVVDELKTNGIHTCIDFVVNHTAKEHEFAQKALDGDPEYMNLYLMYDSKEIPDAYSLTVPEAFPKVAPGNFTYYKEIRKWVFTSFYEFQWDLNYQNPLVFEKIIDILLHLSNKGIDMIRLDAIPFIWKQIGHTCRSHPITHILLRMINIINDIVCPSVALLGEAIIEPNEIVKYFGQDAPECHLMYNATHMVNLWNSIATRDTRLLQIDTNRLNAMSDGCWINYARCHDDIGWGLNESAIKSFGMDPFAHKQFLIDFFSGHYPDSFAIGDLYEFHHETMDARNCGTLASLLGLEKATLEKDVYQKELALKRINLIHGVLMSSSGIPLIYSGDEIGTLNNYDYLTDELKSHDSRWLHRGFFDFEKAEKRNIINTMESQIFTTLKSMINLRKSEDIFSPTYDQHIIDTYNNHIYAFYKNAIHYSDKIDPIISDSSHQAEHLVCLFNFSEDRQFISTNSLHIKNLHNTYEDLLTGKKVNLNNDKLQLGPYEYLWLIQRSN